MRKDEPILTGTVEVYGEYVKGSKPQISPYIAGDPGEPTFLDDLQIFIKIGNMQFEIAWDLPDYVRDEIEAAAIKEYENSGGE